MAGQLFWVWGHAETCALTVLFDGVVFAGRGFRRCSHAGPSVWTGSILRGSPSAPELGRFAGNRTVSAVERRMAFDGIAARYDLVNRVKATTGLTHHCRTASNSARFKAVSARTARPFVRRDMDLQEAMGARLVERRRRAAHHQEARRIASEKNRLWLRPRSRGVSANKLGETIPLQMGKAVTIRAPAAVKRRCAPTKAM